MYVCTSNTSQGRNCGSCEKCVRTRVHLLVAGVLADAGAFAGVDVSESEIRSVRFKRDYACMCFKEALPGLRQLGRHDLTAAVESVVADYVRMKTESARHTQRRLLRRVARKLTRFFPR